MELNNFREISRGGDGDVGAGFQFEFYCNRCGVTWKSPFRPYRMGQLSGMLQMFTLLFDKARVAGLASTGASRARERGAHDAALADAQSQASQRFMMCEGCHKGVCVDCYSANDHRCQDCLREARRSGGGSSAGYGGSSGGYGGAPAGGGSGPAAHGAAGCPNCGSPTDGGRFCPECGFDMASTHKSCPGCGTMVSRSSRFCTDCGHAF